MRVGDSKQKPQILDWAPPTWDHPPGWHYGDYFARVARIYNEHLGNVAMLPASIEKQEVVLTSIQKAYEVWSAYAEGPKPN